MIYLLTQEQKQAIEDALEEINFTSTTKKALPKYMDILAITQSLKPIEPVGYIHKPGLERIKDYVYYKAMDGVSIPIYAPEKSE